MKKKIIILGGGYAGISAAIVLSRYKQFEVLLIDQSEYFIDKIRLQTTLYSFEGLNSIRKPFHYIAQQYGFQYTQACSDLKQESILKAIDFKVLETDKGEQEFDYLVICTGAKASTNNMESNSFYDLERLLQTELSSELRFHISRKKNPVLKLAFIGGGATSLQLLFDVYRYLRRVYDNYEMYLYDMGQSLLPYLPPEFHSYIERKLRNYRISYYPAHRFLSYNGTEIQVRNMSDDKVASLNPDMLFYFPGVKANPGKTYCTKEGMLYSPEKLPISYIYSAGDCSEYEGRGLNALSAQAAVRKGRLIAKNIVNHSSKRNLDEYKHQELGYFISLGKGDAIGWLLNRDNLVKGHTAFLMK
ncbi:MAG: FAD-dependent oxidoreductase, partial [Leptospiraceae bacterium]|nr:FAD-dependent oxidoreductase [Leptospiraceae bacterium]